MRLWGLVVAGAMLAGIGAGSSLAQAPSAQQRRAELAKVQEMINDPDPLMRIANMETIVEEGDALKIQIAIRTAMSSDDRDLRSLAMKAFIARLSEVTFTLSGDAKDMAELQRASTDQARNDVLTRKGNNLRTLENVQYRQKFLFRNFELKNSKGEVTRDGFTAPNYWRNFAVIGDRLVFTTSTCMGSANSCPCEVEVRPTKDLKLVGAARCQINGWPPIGLSAEVN